MSYFREHTGKACSRRILGTFGFLACVAAVFCQIQHPLLESLLWTSAALIGLTTADVWAVRKKGGGAE